MWSDSIEMVIFDCNADFMREHHTLQDIVESSSDMFVEVRAVSEDVYSWFYLLTCSAALLQGLLEYNDVWLQD